MATAAQTLALPHEDIDKSGELLDRYAEEFLPESHHEAFLVEQMAHARSSLARIQRLQLALFSGYSRQPGTDPDQAILAALQQSGASVPAILLRCAAAAERSYYKAHKEFTAARELRARRGDAEIRNEAKQAERALADYIMNPPTPHRSTLERMPLHDRNGNKLKLPPAGPTLQKTG